MSEVSVLGTGLMGSAVARALVLAGRSVTVWNRTHEKTGPLVEAGAEVVTEAQDALRRSPVSILLVSSYDAVYEILDKADPQEIGDLVNLVTASLDEAERLAPWAAERDLGILNGAIHVLPRGIGDPESQISFCGAEDIWERHSQLLVELAGNSQYVGPQLHLATAVECASLAYSSSVIAALLEAAALGRSLGLPTQAVMDRLGRGHAVLSRFIEYAAPKIADDDHATDQATIDTWEPHIRVVADTGLERGLPSRQVSAAAEALAAARAAGYGSCDITAIHAQVRALAADVGDRQGTAGLVAARPGTEDRP
jgi:3-hydroxyisobutyrate dehydrogenase-like beta-hydroxyacid dehydrogenase